MKKKVISIYISKIYIYIKKYFDVKFRKQACTANDWNVMQEDLDYFEKQKEAQFIWKSKGW